MKAQIPGQRIEGLSDLIFGLALSIGAIQLVGNIPKDYGNLVADIIAFAFSFFILITVWFRYTTIMSVLPTETRWVVMLNLALLFLVAIEPFLFNLLVIPQDASAYGLEDPVSQFYAFDIGGMNLVLASLAHALTSEERGLLRHELLDRYRNYRNMLLLSAFLFFISALPPFWIYALGGVPLRVVFWIGILFLSMAARRLGLSRTDASSQRIHHPVGP